MLLKESEVKSIRENKLTFVKNFTPLTKEYDFNWLSSFMEKNCFSLWRTTDIGNLKDIFQIKWVKDHNHQFMIWFNFFNKLFKYQFHPEDNVDIFFNLVSQGGNVHKDAEDVFIIGLHGTTVYKIFNEEVEDYHIEKGDMIFIPKHLKHKSIAMTPRVTASIGFYNSRFNG